VKVVSPNLQSPKSLPRWFLLAGLFWRDAGTGIRSQATHQRRGAMLPELLKKE
jgi:hypothetical protein